MAMYQNEPPQVDLQALQGVFKGGSVWVVLALIAILAAGMYCVRIGEVSGEEVGVLLNKLNGEMKVIPESGRLIYNGITKRLYVLDKRLHSMEMTEVAGRGDRPDADNLKIKTVDGSDVYVDLKVQYRIDPEKADVVLTTSGSGDMFKQKWIRDYARSVTRNYLGELTTEEFYDSSKRNAKILMAEQETNRSLSSFGLKIDGIVIPKKPQFYKEYEEMIRNKKSADQAVEEEKSKALAAQQRQEKLGIEEMNRKKVEIVKFAGQMEQKKIKALAEAEQIKKNAEAYYNRVTIAADATLYEKEKQATAILAEKSKEAAGIKELREALEGEGGRNMVKLEYARKLKGVTIVGKPYSIDAHTKRFQHLTAPAASSGR